MTKLNHTAGVPGVVKDSLTGPAMRPISDKEIEQIAAGDELTGDAILDFAHRLLTAAANPATGKQPLQVAAGVRASDVTPAPQRCRGCAESDTQCKNPSADCFKAARGVNTPDKEQPK